MPSPFAAKLETYLRRVVDRQARLDLSLFQEGQERDFSSVPLDRFYVPLRLAGRPLEEGAQPERRLAREKGEENELRSTQILTPSRGIAPHLALLGDAGSGKTTILRHLAGSLARACLEQNPGLAQEQTGLKELLVPLLVPLRYFHHFCRGDPSPRPISWHNFVAFLAHYFTEHYGLTADHLFYQTLLGTGRCLLALDGFDEIPDLDARRQVLRVVHSLATDSRLGHNRIILSSRVAAYGGSTQLGGDFQTLWVQPLNPEERAEQVRQWVAGVSPYTERPLQAGDILNRMPPGSSLDQLAVTPMIVTTLCVVYFYDHELPEQRAQLYRRCVDIMLYEKLRPDEPGRSLADLAGKPDFKRQLLARLAFEMHQARQEEMNKERAARWLKDGFRSLADEEARLAAANTFLETITSRGTLLQERAGHFSFGRQHLTFREFLAGYHLILGLRPQERQALWPSLLPDDRWREPVRLAVGAAVLDNTLTCEDFLHELLAVAEGTETGPALRLAGYRLAAEALWDVGRSGRALLDQALQSQIRQGLATRLLEKAITAPAAGLLPQRAAAGQVLGRLGDPREGVVTLPPLLTQVIPAGEFSYGDGERRTVAAFQAGVYLITNE